MSLIQKIVSRSPQDLINEGYKLAITGSAALVTDSIIWTGTADRAIIITGFTLSSNQATAVLVSLGFRLDLGTTLNFFQGYVSSGASFCKEFPLGDWYRGGLGYDLVLTTSGAGPIAFTVDTRVTSFPAELGYIENYGAQSATAHSGQAWFPNPAGLARGQSEV